MILSSEQTGCSPGAPKNTSFVARHSLSEMANVFPFAHACPSLVSDRTSTPIIDGHIDLPELTRIIYGNNITDFDLESDMPGQVDVGRLRKGKVGGFFFSYGYFPLLILYNSWLPGVVTVVNSGDRADHPVYEQLLRRLPTRA
jgi:hypothetical protein